MKLKIKYLVIGIIFGVLVTSTIPVIADSIEVLFNSVGLKVYNKQISQIGESYTLQNGNQVPYTITYKGTTYLPVRKIAEIFSVNIDYDNSTKNVIIGKSTEDNPDDYLPPVTYEEFKNMWTVTEHEPGSVPSYIVFHGKYNGKLSREEFDKIWNALNRKTYDEYSIKMLKEYINLYTEADVIGINYMYKEEVISSVQYRYGEHHNGEFDGKFDTYK